MAVKNNNYLKPTHNLNNKYKRYSNSSYHRSHHKLKDAVKDRTCIPTVFIYCLPCVTCVLLFWNCVYGDFVHDDVMAIKDNKDVTGQAPLTEILYNDFWGKSMSDNTSHKSYRPLCVLSFRLNYWLAGGSYPYSFHVVNVILHAVSCIIFTRILRTILCYVPMLAMTGGMLFATHPIHTEAVAGVVGRADILACIFFLLTFHVYSRSMENKTSSQGFPPLMSYAFFIASLLLATCSMLVKEHGATVLGVILLYDIYVVCHKGVIMFLREKMIHKIWNPLMKRGIVIIFVTSVLLTCRIYMNNGQSPAFSNQDNPASFFPYLQTRFLTYCYLCVFNTWLLLCPSTLSYDWQMASIPLVDSLIDSRNLATLVFFVILLVLVALCVHGFQRGAIQRKLFVGLVFTILPFLPASNLFFRVGFVVAERILYIPSMGFIIIVLCGLEKLLLRFHDYKKTIYTLVLLVLVVFSIRTVIRNQVWRSREALFWSGVVTLPHNAKVHYNYANYLKDVGKKHQAIHHYKTALSLCGNHASANNNLGTLLEDQNQAEKLYRKAIDLAPRHVGAHFNLGNSLYLQGRTQDAVAMLNRALEINPDFASAYTSLASIMSDSKQHGQAKQYYLEVIKRMPHDGNGYNNYGAFLHRQGNLDLALQYYNKAYTVQPDHVTSIVNAAKLLRSMGKTDNVEKLFKRALSLKQDVAVVDNLAIFYYKSGRLTEAAKLYETVITQLATNDDAMAHYAQMLADLGHIGDAEYYLMQVIERAPSHIEAVRRLAGLYGIQKQHSKALELLSRCINSSQSNVSSVELASLYSDKANHYKDMKQLSLAAQDYKVAMKLNPVDAQTYINLGAIHHLNDEFAKAEYYYSEALKLTPDNSILKENIQKLKRRKKQVMGA